MTFFEQQLLALSKDTANIELAHDAGVQASVDGFDELAEMLLEAEDDYDVEEALKAWPIDVAIHMTYYRVDDESAAEGAHSDHGFYEPGGWFYSIDDEDFLARVERDGQEKALEDMTPEPARFKRLDEAVSYVSDRGGLGTSSSRAAPGDWYTTSYPDQDYETGEDTYYSFHIEGSDDDQRKLNAALKEAGVLI